MLVSRVKVLDQMIATVVPTSKLNQSSDFLEKNSKEPSQDMLFSYI